MVSVVSLPIYLGVQVSISVENLGFVNEGIGAVPIFVSLTGELDIDVTVQIEIVDGTGMYSLSLVLFVTVRLIVAE